MTHRPITPLRKEEAAVGALGPVLDRLAADGAHRVYLDGGELVCQGLAEGVVDELIVSVVPVMLGKGRPLFGPEVPEQSWTLTGVQGFATGLVQMRYRRG